MQIVIDMPEKIIEWINGYYNFIKCFNGEKIGIIADAIKNGTPLPKGHGRLIDANVLWDAYQDLGQDFYEAFDFAEANAVIEADEENT